MAPPDEPRSQAADPAEELPRMSFGDHLDELRKRLLRALLALVGALVLIMPFHDQVIGIVVEPYRILWQGSFQDYVAALEARAVAGTMSQDGLDQRYLEFCRQHQQAILDGTFAHPHAIPWETGFRVPYELVAISGIEDVWTFLSASLLFAFALASPVVIWQIWAFIAAGLYQKERKVFTRYFPFMVVLLLGGILFGYFLAVPFGLSFLIKLMNMGQVQPMLAVGQYFTILFSLTTALGLLFQLPLVMVALQRVGLLRHETMVKKWRLVILIIFLISAVLTPTPDPFNLLLMAVPAVLLYVLGLFLTARGRRHEAPL